MPKIIPIDQARKDRDFVACVASLSPYSEGNAIRDENAKHVLNFVIEIARELERKAA